MRVTGSNREQKTVKAFTPDIALINEHAKKLNCSAAEIIHAMCEALRKREYENELQQAFQAIANNKEAFSEVHSENSDWDGTLIDGLDDATT